jgi:hypothetical protein
MFGWKPANDAMTRTTSSSSVLREFTIQSASRYRTNSSNAVLRARPDRDGTPSPHSVVPSCRVTRALSSRAGARLKS